MNAVYVKKRHYLVTGTLVILFVVAFVGVMIFDLSYFAAQQALQAQIRPEELISLKWRQPVRSSPQERHVANIREEVDTGALVMLVPLNGTPTYSEHLSVVNARAALKVLTKVQAEERYLVLSEGRIRNTCLSGAMLTAQYLGIEPGYNEDLDLTVLLEEKATTTVENIWFTDPILQEKVLRGDTNKPVTVLVVGVSDVNPEVSIGMLGFQIPGVDIGHGARAYLNAVRQWPVEHGQISTLGYIPSDLITSDAVPYPTRYSLATWVLTVTGALYLPIFDRPEAPEADCTEQTYRYGSSTIQP